jgi:glucose-1-phosphate thymidylyltransferase
LENVTVAKWKGVLLAGGTGSRLLPLTFAVNKHLLPVYDKPMLYYPLTTLMLGGVRDFVVVSSPNALIQIRECLGDGARWGISFDYVAQPTPRGIADAFLVAEPKVSGCNIALALGDNIFYGTGLPNQIREAISRPAGATIFGYEVLNPSSFGVVTLDAGGRPVALEEKPTNPTSNLAVPGLYFYDSKVIEFAKRLTPSVRGELEITDVNRAYMNIGELRVFPMGRGTAWLDGGAPQSLFDAGQFVKVFEDRTGLKIACPEEVAYRMHFIDLDQLSACVSAADQTSYAAYIRSIVRRERSRAG